MKRNICIALTACCLTLFLDRPAQAWSKFNFGVGLNLGWEGAGNTVLWGLMRGGPAPGQDGASGPGFGHAPYGPGYGPGYGQAPAMPPAQGPAPAQAGGFDPGMFGDASQFAMRNGMGYPPGLNMPFPMAPQGMQGMPVVQPMPAVQPMPQMPRADAQPVGYWTYPQYGNGYVYPQYNNGYYYPGAWYGY